MGEWTLQFALVAATLVGTILAVFIGRLLDSGSKRGSVIGVWVEPIAEIIDFTHMGFLLKPKNGDVGLERIFKRSCIVKNVGFETVQAFEITLNSDYGVSFNPASEFADFNLEKFPNGLKVDVQDGAKFATGTQVVYKFDFMNRGDYLKITYIASRDVKIDFLAHHPDTEIKFVSSPDLIPTVRQKIGSLISRGRVFEFAAGAIAAGIISTLMGTL